MEGSNKPTEIGSTKMFGGYNKRFKHYSPTLGCSMNFHVYFPPSPSLSTKFPVRFPTFLKKNWMDLLVNLLKFLFLCMCLSWIFLGSWLLIMKLDFSCLHLCRCFTGFLVSHALTRISYPNLVLNVLPPVKVLLWLFQILLPVSHFGWYFKPFSTDLPRMHLICAFYRLCCWYAEMVPLLLFSVIGV